MDIFGEITRSFQNLCEPCRVPDALREESVPYLQRSHGTAAAAEAAREADILSTRREAAYAVSSTAVPFLERKTEVGQGRSPDTAPDRQLPATEQAKLEDSQAEEARLERLRKDMSLLTGGWRGTTLPRSLPPTHTT